MYMLIMNILYALINEITRKYGMSLIYKSKPSLQSEHKAGVSASCLGWAAGMDAIVNYYNDPYVYTDSLSPPKNVRLLGVSPGVLVFSWTPVPLNCSAVAYEIRSSCGECPTLTNSTMVICVMHNPLVQYRMCRFAVRSVMCNSVGGWSNEIEVILRGIIIG